MSYEKHFEVLLNIPNEQWKDGNKGYFTSFKEMNVMIFMESGKYWFNIYGENFESETAMKKYIEIYEYKKQEKLEFRQHILNKLISND